MKKYTPPMMNYKSLTPAQYKVYLEKRRSNRMAVMRMNDAVYADFHGMASIKEEDTPLGANPFME